MTKPQARQIELAKRYIALGMIDVAARSVSACIRCALRQRDVVELMAFAELHGLTQNPEFIV